MFPHVDAGEYYRIRDRYHLVLRSALGSPLTAGEETVTMREGELWAFDNKARHEARNPSPEPRVHLIFDVLPPPGRGFFARPPKAGDAAQEVAGRWRPKSVGRRILTAAARAWAAESTRTALS